MKTFLLEIVTPERVAYSSEVEMVTAPGVMGTIGILSRHTPLFSQLVAGEVKIVKGSEEIFLAVGGGFLEVTQDKVLILVTRAVKAQELNEQEVLRAKKQAEEALRDKPTGKELDTAQALLRQSLVDMRILRRRKRRH